MQRTRLETRPFVSGINNLLKLGVCASRKRPYWRVCCKNLNIVSMCATSPVVHTSNISSCQKKKFSFPVAMNNSIKVCPLFVFFCYKCLYSRRTLWNTLYLYNGKSEIIVNINTGSEKLWKKKHCDCGRANYSRMYLGRLCLYFLFMLMRSARVYFAICRSRGLGFEGQESILQDIYAWTNHLAGRSPGVSSVFNSPRLFSRLTRHNLRES